MSRSTGLLLLSVPLCIFCGECGTPPPPGNVASEMVGNTLRYIYRAGSGARPLNFARVVGCGQDCANLCSAATGTAAITNEALLRSGVPSPDSNEQPMIRFTMNVPKFTDGNAIVQCGFISDAFRVAAATDSANPAQIRGRLSLTTNCLFATGLDANNYILKVELRLFGSNDALLTTREASFCRNIAIILGTPLVGCDTPVPDTAEIGLNLADFNFDTQQTYRLGAALLVGLGGAQDPTIDYGGQLEGVMTITACDVCVDCPA
jgi:hypothetical protein